MQATCLLSYELTDSWKRARDGWGIALHRICSRTGSFPPALAYYFIMKYSRFGDVVLDPFSGKGTAPLEACLNGRVGIGNDLSPEAYVLTKAKVRPVPYKRVLEWIRWAEARMNPSSYRLSEVSDDVKAFFSNYTLRQILAVRDLIDETGDEDLANFIRALMLGILHGPTRMHLSVRCSHSFSMAPGYVKRYVRENCVRKPRRNVLRCLRMKAERVFRDGIPAVRGEAYMEDARRLPIEDESVDFVITSPPYFNMQTYAWDNWLRLWFLGYDYEDVARRLFHTESVKKFKQFIKDVLEEIFRVLKWDRAAVIVLGRVKLKGMIIDMAEVTAPIAEEMGFKVAGIISDSIPKSNKHLWYLKEDDGVSKEVILELHKGDFEPSPIRIDWENAKPLTIAREEVVG
ncbi:MAG: DNA methyltransferase [Nitrososphaerota archaeon]